MKNTIKCIGIIALIAIIGFGISACKETDTSCSHNFSLWQERTAPTCLMASVETEKCSKCGELGIEKQVGKVALGHQGINAMYATCTGNGNTGSGTCTRTGCGQVIIGTVIPALGHQGSINAIYATCTGNGNTGFGFCGRCGQAVTGTVIPALGHEHIESLICKRVGCNHQYALGDTGPGGGKIIYIAPTIAGFEVTSTTPSFETYTAYYLEAAPLNAAGGTGVQATMRWGSSFNIGTGTRIGSGRNNTALIIAREKAAHPSDTYIYAALACDNYSISGFNDWFLPSIDELYQLLIRREYFSITSGTYWSSSQALNWDFALSQSFSSGLQDASGKLNNNNVRPIRAF